MPPAIRRLFQFRISNFEFSLLALAVPILLVPPAQAQEKWAVPAATMRFKADVDMPPDSPEAGIIVTIPNGGALPGPFPNAIVFDSAGQPLRSECLWNNPEEGMAIILPVPAASGPVTIYLQGASNPANPWSPDSALHPGLLLYTRVGHSTLDDAKNMAGENPPGQGIRMGQVPMIADAENRFGPSDNFASYYTGWINVPEAGPVFIGTISQDGSTVMIDGRVAADWPGMHTPREGLTGKKGTTISLTKGPHRVQYFQFTAEGGPLCQMIWHLPSMKQAIPDSPRNRDFIQSGTARITSAESRAGAPPAFFDRNATSYLSFANQFVDLFELTVPLADSDKGATLDWLFSDGFRARGPRVLWPVVRGTSLAVTLTASGPGGQSSSTRRIYPDTLPEGAKVDNYSTRRDYAEALLNRLAGAPAGTDPTDSWPRAFWEILPQVVEGGEAKDLLAFLFQHCTAGLKNLGADDLRRISDVYYDELKLDKANTLPILNKIIATDTDPGDKFHWELKEIDFELFEVGDIAAARQVAAVLNPDPFRGGINDAEFKLIAQGDIERAAGNIDTAKQYYTAAQAMNQKAHSSTGGGFTGFSDPTRQAVPSKDGIVITAADSQDADWRKRAVVQNSFYTEVKNLLDQDALEDARDKLDAWAIAFPLDKLGGDYTLAEAEYALKLDNQERAQRVLKAYRNRVDLSPQLAEAMELEWGCDAELQNPADIKELAADIKKRFPDLPLAREADKALQGQMPKSLLGHERRRHAADQQQPSQ